MNNETPVRPETPSRENRGLDALFSRKPSNESLEDSTKTESPQQPQQVSLLSKMGQGLKNLVVAEEKEKPVQNQLSNTLRQKNNTQKVQNVAAAKMLQRVQEAAGELLQPEETADDDLVVEARSAALKGQATITQQQQQQAAVIQQQQAQQQKMLEERKKKQAEIDRRKRLRLASLKNESLVKSVAKDQLNPLDVGLMSTPFGILWGMVKLPKWIGKILP